MTSAPPKALAQLLIELGDDDPKIRRAAARGLADLADRGSFEALQRVARADEDVITRAEATSALAFVADADAVPVLLDLLADREPGIRAESAAALAGIEPHPADRMRVIDRLVQRLHDADVETRAAAAGALAGMRAESAREPFANLLGDREDAVRFEAVYGLALLTDRRAAAHLPAFLEDKKYRFDAAYAAAELGDPALLPALQRYGSRFFIHPLEKLQAAASRYRLGEREAVSHLLERVQSRRSDVRGYAIELCGALQVPESFGQLCEILGGDPNHADAAARALGMFGDSRAVAPLCRVLTSHSDPEVRADAATALGLIGDGSARAALIAAKEKDSVAEVSQAAADALAELDRLLVVGREPSE